MSKKNISKKELINLLRLVRTQGIGEITLYSLLEIFGTAENALSNLPLLAQNVKKTIFLPTEDEVIKEIEETEKFGGKFITLFDDEYSKNLSQIKDCPPIIIALGNEKLLQQNSIAIVGARAATLNSCMFAYKLAKDLAEMGFNIVSGLAAGIDTAAHKIIYDNLPTTAVIATGINIVYPRENNLLCKKIVDNGGLIISEIPFNVQAKPQHFSRRNRIISGLSRGVVLVEAGIESGSLITANYAILHGRRIFAVPGSPIDNRFRGTNALIKDGAILLESAEDVTKSLKSQISFFEQKSLSEGRQHHKITLKEINYHYYQNNDSNKVKNKILQLLDYSPLNIDLLLANLDVENRLALIALTELELEGKIMRDNNNISLVYHMQ